MKRTVTLRRLRLSILGYNKYLTCEYLSSLSIVTLLRLCHPLDRQQYAFQLFKEEFINNDELLEFLKK